MDTFLLYNDGVGVKPSRTIGNKIPQINRTKQEIFNIFNSIKDTFEPAYRSVSWHGTAKSEGEKHGGNRIFKNAELAHYFAVENVGSKNSVISNHVDSNHISTESNHVDLNNEKWNQLIPTNSINIGSINDSSNICELHRLFSWDMDSTDAAGSNFSRGHLLTYRQQIQLIHLLQYIHYILTLRYLLHEYLLMEQANLNHNRMNHHNKVWHLKEILRHERTNSLQYQTYQLTWIHIQFFIFFFIRFIWLIRQQVF